MGKALLCFAVGVALTTNLYALESGITGKIKLTKALAKKIGKNSTLFVMAKRVGRSGPPVAVVKIKSPVFPQKFKISQNDVMMKGLPFEGPFIIAAKLSPSGDAMDGMARGSHRNPVPIGSQNIEVILKR
ncbi:MAG: hypothetical protein HOE90_09975 [Bacteriovoracaceae bacterium]|jgi:hypothetical protein|nr:hypothetical protein [Bacteriovoracaceae bacterium]